MDKTALEVSDEVSDAELASLARTFLAARDVEWDTRFALWRAMRERDETTIIVDDALISRDDGDVDSLKATRYLKVE